MSAPSPTPSGRFAAALVLATACASSGPTRSGESSGSILWNGIDTRPVAVDSELRITFTSADPLLCCGSGYEVASLEPAILSVQDLGGQQISIKGLAPGFATVEVSSPSQVVGRLGVAVRAPAKIALADPSHLTAGIDVPLPLGFAVRAMGLELITIQVLDDSGQLLAFSPTLLAFNSSGPIQVAAQGAETLAVAGENSGDQGCFDVELASTTPGGDSEDFSCSRQEHDGWPIYQVSVVEAPATVEIDTRALPGTTERALAALAIARGADGVLEVLGVAPWSFSLTGIGLLVPTAPASVNLIFTPSTPDSASTLTVTDGVVHVSIQVPR